MAPTKKPEFWRDSKAKQMLLDDLRNGRVPLQKGDGMTDKEVFASRIDLYNQFGGYKNFPSRLKRAREMITIKKDRSASDAAAFAHDRTLFPEKTVNHSGQPIWRDSCVAKGLLTKDIEDGKHKTLTKKELWLSRNEYFEVYSLEVFRGKVYQTEKTLKFNAQFKKGGSRNLQLQR